MTATWRSREELIVQLVTLHRQGLSRRAIARALGISRNTVRVLARGARGARETEHEALAPRPSRAPRASKVDAYQVRVAELLRQYPDITAQRVFETLREEGFTGGYTAVKKAVRRLRPPPRPEPSLATPDYGPGEMAENDWSPYEVTFADGHKEKVQAFSYVLVYSRRKYFDLYRHADLYALMDGHVRAFARFEGCARTLHLRQPEERRAALGRTAAHLQSTLPRLRRPLRVSPPRRARRPQRQGVRFILHLIRRVRGWFTSESASAGASSTCTSSETRPPGPRRGTGSCRCTRAPSSGPRVARS